MKTCILDVCGPKSETDVWRWEKVPRTEFLSEPRNLNSNSGRKWNTRWVREFRLRENLREDGSVSLIKEVLGPWPSPLECASDLHCEQSLVRLHGLSALTMSAQAKGLVSRLLQRHNMKFKYFSVLYKSAFPNGGCTNALVLKLV